MRYRKKLRKSILIFICLGSMTAGFGCTRQAGQMMLSDDTAVTEQKEEGEPQEKRTSSAKKAEAAVEQKIYIHVCGGVNSPGLYVFPAGTRTGKAIEAAGGFTAEADEAAVNLAQVLEDGMQVYVPSVQEKSRESETAGEKTAVQERNLVNINTAAKEELVALPGIGESRAEAILSYREEKGSFSSIEDIRNVTGIGEGIFEKIKDFITV